jgi:pimeloyl-ACP methyl ester carboxylesterase
MMSAMGDRGRRWIALVAVALALPFAAAPTAGADGAPAPGPRPEDGSPAPGGANDWSCTPSAAHPRPVVLVHGLFATMGENWGWFSPKVKAAGYCVFALTYGELPGNPYFGGMLPMQESAIEVGAFVDRVLAATGATQVDLVGHSEGTVVPQWWLKKLGGAPKVHTYVAIAPIYRGTTLHGLDSLIRALKEPYPELSGPFSDAVDRWCGSCQQLLAGSPFFHDLYGDGAYAAPGVSYTTVMTRYDELVTPYTSGRIGAPGSTDVVLQELCPLNLDEHLMVIADPTVLRIALNALDPAHAQPVSCGPTLGLGLGPLQL